MNHSLVFGALLATFLPLSLASAAAPSAPQVREVTLPAAARATPFVELLPAARVVVPAVPLAAIPDDYAAWVNLPVDRLLAMKAGDRLRFNLPHLGPLDVSFEGTHTLDGSGRVVEWQGHRVGRSAEKIILVRGLSGALSGTIDFGGERLLLGNANGEHLLYRAGIDVPGFVSVLPQILVPVATDAAMEHAAKPAAVSFPVAVNLVGLAEVPVGGETELTLPEVGSYTVVHDNTLAGDLGASTFVGYLKEYGNDFRVVITSSPAGSIGSIISPQGEFKLLTDKGSSWVVDVRRSGLQGLVPNEDDGVSPSAEAAAAAAEAASAAGPAAQAGATSGTAAATTATNTATGTRTVIDVMVLYGPGLEQRLGAQQALARIQHLMALTNQAYVDSLVNIDLRLVKAVKLDALVDASNNSQTLADLAAGRGAFASVPALRQQHGADLVLVLRPFRMNAQGRSCGVGYVGGYGGSAISGYASYGYSVVSDGTDMEGSSYYCTDYTFAHELGHNMGSMHDRATVASQGGGSGAYPYAYGYGQSGKFGTVMSYISPVVGKFSNPTLSTCGTAQACGVISSAAQSADNAQSLNNTRTAVAGFMASTASPTLYISGVASLGTAPLAGVNVSGAGATCTPSAANGAYSCQVASGWSGTLTPALSGYTFVPDKLQFTQLAASRTLQNWKATALPPVTISGVATLGALPLAGVRVAGSGATCTNSAANGTYSCTVASGWSGTLTPSLAGYGFTPSQLQFTAVTTSRTQQNWRASALPVTISGSATVAGQPLAGVAIAGSGATCSATASNGTYSCTVASGWSGTLTPSLAGYSFAPDRLQFSAVTTARTQQNWRATALPVTISGMTTVGGQPLAGVRVTGSGATCTTSASNGAYRCTVPRGWSGNLVPALAGYGFTPAQLAFSQLTSARTQQNFIAARLPVTISGVAAVGSQPLAGVRITGSGANCTATATNGAYSCTVAYGWSGSLTPALAGYTFTPDRLQFTQVTTARTQQNWRATAQPVTLSGIASLSGRPLAGVKVVGSGATCTDTAANGGYSCQVPRGWAGRLTAAKTGHVFYPSAWIVTQAGASASGLNWMASVLR